MSRFLHGTVNLPRSKSESNRALMIAAYGGFPLEVDGLSDAHDTVLLKALLERSSLRGGTTKQSIVDSEDAGTVARFLLTYLANKPGNWLLTGNERLSQRPIAPLIEALRQLGANVTTPSLRAERSGALQSQQESLPLQIVGKPLEGGRVTLDASQSSQFASSLLLAAPTWEQGLHLTLTGNPVSMPYLEMTIKMMECFGVQVTRSGKEVAVKQQPYRPCSFTVSADWSAASYWYEMLALSDGGELLLKGLISHSLQGDAIIVEWFKPFGITTTFEPQGARLIKQNPIKEFPQNLVFDFTNNPDLFPAVYATCVALNVDAVFKGTETLSVKESDRLNALKTELSIIPQNSPLSLPVFCTYGDHRIAMSLASLWPLFGPVTVDNPSVVGKSYPSFWEEMKRFMMQ